MAKRGKPAKIAEGVSDDGETVVIATEPYPPPPAVKIGALKSKRLAEDLSGLDAKQRRYWKGAAARYRRMDAAAKAKFIKALAQWPDLQAAATSAGFTVRSFQYQRARDPAFAAAWEDALKASLPAVERAARIRAFEGTLEPIVQNGRVVAHRRVYSDRLAELTLRKLDPAGYSEKMMVSQQVNGTINHVHSLSPALQALAEKVTGLGAPVIEARRVDEPSRAPADLVAEIVGRRIEAPKPQDVVPEPVNQGDDPAE